MRDTTAPFSKGTVTVKRAFYFVILAVFLISMFVIQPQDGLAIPKQSPEKTDSILSGMPLRPVPDKPIPHHDPGQSSRAGSYQMQMQRTNADGVEETIELHGLDAMLADGTMTDPLQGNYELAEMGNILMGTYGDYLDTDRYYAQVYNAREEDLEGGYDVAAPVLIDNSGFPFGPDTNVSLFDLTTGDLNGDGLDEQIVARNIVDNEVRRVSFCIGDLYGQQGKLGSAPAVVRKNEFGYHLLVAGYDQALWHTEFPPVWDNKAGGMLLSGPALATMWDDTFTGLDYTFTAFAFGYDGQIYYRKWDRNGWGADWAVAVSTPTLLSLGSMPPVSGQPAQGTYELAATIDAEDKIDLFYLGADRTLRWQRGTAGNWDYTQNLGGPLASGPAAIYNEKGQIEVYAVGVNGELWWRIKEGAADWGNWGTLGAPEGWTFSDAPGAVRHRVSLKTFVFVPGVKDGEHALWYRIKDGEIWGNWIKVSDDVSERVAVTDYAEYSNKVRVWKRSNNGILYQAEMSEGDDTLVWDTRGGLPTGCNWTPGPNVYDAESPVFVETGYFSGDGRQQIVLAFENAEAKLQLNVYDIQGFIPVKMGEFIYNVAFSQPAIATGDFDGDGQDEIGVAFYNINDNVVLSIINVDPSPPDAWALVELATTSYGNVAPYKFTIIAGDMDGDGAPKLRDELFLSCSYINLYDKVGFSVYQLNDSGGSFSLDQKGNWEQYSNDNGKWQELAAGDVDGDGLTEIVYLGPLDATPDYDWLDQELVIFEYDGSSYFHILASKGIYNGYAKLALATGDLNRDLDAEIALLRYAPGVNEGALQVYDYTLEGMVEYNVKVDRVNDAQYSAALAIGNLIGESLRVGPPTYRVQHEMNTPVVFLNKPPVHHDIVKDSEGKWQEIESQLGAYVTHTAGTTYEDEAYMMSKRDWTLSAGIDTSLGAGGNTVSTSLGNTYGESFENTEGTIATISFLDTTIAQQDDQVIYNGTSYAIWEYPVYGLEGEALDQTIAVTWPLLTTTESPSTMGGQYDCDETFYAPSHQVDNVWSYKPIGEEDLFGDYSVDNELLRKTSTGGSDVSLELTNVDIKKLYKSFSNQISAGLEYSYENELNIPLIGNVWDYSFRAHVNGQYSLGEMSTFSSTLTIDTKVELSYDQDSINGYEVEVYFYWGKGGYLVVDYQTEPPADQGFWSYYNKPDPAFILPWYGFPDVNGSFPNTGTTGAPLCGVDKQLFSHDVNIHPQYADIGDTVTISATVRNFSNVGSPGFSVSFYQGYPDSQDGNLIGSCRIDTLARSSGPKQCTTDWTVTRGSGEQKIYAVIDPDHVVDEIHDEGDPIDNNIAYGLLYIAGSDYADPGLRQKQAYQEIHYEIGEGLNYSAFWPTVNGTESLRLELIPIPDEWVEPVVGEPFKLDIFRGGQQDPETYYDFTPAPAAIEVTYRDSDITGIDENLLKLYRKDEDDNSWVEATCDGYEAVHFTQDNQIVVPICEVGTFVLSYSEPVPPPPKYIFLPFVHK